MNRIVISQETNPCYNLALEESLLFRADSETLFYIWVNHSCVVLGRNQNPYMECDMDYLKSSQIGLVRRKSGGGAVYQDTGNLNYTFINREGEGNEEKQRKVLTGMFDRLGLNAVYSGRNDILIEDRKVSGQAKYCDGGNEYLHGTLMVHVNLEHLERSLRPSEMKLRSRGISSVSSRVINMTEYIPDLEVKTVEKLLIEQFIQVYGPSEPVIYMDSSGERPEQQDRYESREWIVDSCPGYTALMEMPYLGGVLKLKIQVKNGVIVNVQGSSDSLSSTGIDWIKREICGIGFDKELIINRIGKRG